MATRNINNEIMKENNSKLVMDVIPSQEEYFAH